MSKLKVTDVYTRTITRDYTPEEVHALFINAVEKEAGGAQRFPLRVPPKVTFKEIRTGSPDYGTGIYEVKVVMEYDLSRPIDVKENVRM